MKLQYPNMLARYIGTNDEKTPHSTLEQLARNRNLVKAGGKADTTRAASVFVQDLRQGKLGKVTLDQPSEKL
jgi:ribosome biogenesis GTPase A